MRTANFENWLLNKINNKNRVQPLMPLERWTKMQVNIITKLTQAKEQIDLINEVIGTFPIY